MDGQTDKWQPASPSLKFGEKNIQNNFKILLHKNSFCEYM